MGQRKESGYLRALGPFLATPDEIPDPCNLKMC